VRRLSSPSQSKVSNHLWPLTSAARPLSMPRRLAGLRSSSFWTRSCGVEWVGGWVGGCVGGWVWVGGRAGGNEGVYWRNSGGCEGLHGWNMARCDIGGRRGQQLGPQVQG
jgi:hypothetical protein